MESNRAVRRIAASGSGLLACMLLLAACTGAPTPRRPGAPGGGVTTPSAPATPSTPATSTASPESSWPGSIGGLAHPTAMAAPDDGSHRLFVTEQDGRIRLIKDGAVVKTPAIDLRSKVGSSGSEQGLLGLAFPPGFASKQYAYVDFTDRNGDTRIYRVRVSTRDPDVFDPASMQLILTVPQPYPNHNGGQLAFGPDDGYLYIGMGDGGSANDPGNRAQNTKQLLGKILRIDTESKSDAAGYAIPADNPFADGKGGRPEIWLVGLRNPWRFSFDAATGDLWIGDVGQDAWEEIDRIPPGSGGANLGWSLYEGNHLLKAKSRLSGFVWPVDEYAHSLGISVTGGYVYRGATHPAMKGVYVFGDFGSGTIWTLERTAKGSWSRRAARKTIYQISTFGQDASGELWVADWGAGVIHRLGDLTR